MLLLFVAFFFLYKATQCWKRSEFLRHFSSFFFFYRFYTFIREWKNYDKSFSSSRFSSAGHRGDEWIKLGIKLRWKFNFTRLVNMLILRAKILFYRPASSFCNCEKRKRLLWANKNARLNRLIVGIFNSSVPTSFFARSDSPIAMNNNLLHDILK